MQGQARYARCPSLAPRTTRMESYTGLRREDRLEESVALTLVVRLLNYG